MERRRTERFSGLKPSKRLHGGIIPSLSRGRSESRTKKEGFFNRSSAKNNYDNTANNANNNGRRIRGRSASIRPLNSQTEIPAVQQQQQQLRRGKSMPGKLNKLKHFFGGSAPNIYAMPPPQQQSQPGRKSGRTGTISRSRSTGSRKSTRSTGSRKSTGSRRSRSRSAGRGSSDIRYKRGSKENLRSDRERKTRSSGRNRFNTKEEKSQRKKEKGPTSSSNNNPSSKRRESKKSTRTRKTGLGTTVKSSRKPSNTATATNHKSQRRKSSHPLPKRKPKPATAKSKPKPRSKSMPPLSTPFPTLKTRRDSSPVSPLPSLDSSWRYQAVKLSREMKRRFKDERRGVWDVPDIEEPRPSNRHSKERRRNRQTTRRGRTSRTSRPEEEKKYRSKSADSIFISERGALIPYRHPTHNEYDIDFDKYDNAAFWEEELYDNEMYDNLPEPDSFDDELTHGSLSLHTSKYGRSYPSEAEDGEYGAQHDPVSSLQGSSWNKSNGSKSASSSGEKPKKTSRKSRNEDDFDISISVNDLEKDMDHNNSGESFSNSERRENQNSSASASFIVPPSHSEVRANMPAFPFAPKPTLSKNSMVRNAVARATSLRDETEEGMSSSLTEISELTNPTYAPPLHAEVRANMPKKAGSSNSSGNGSSVDVVSELTMPSVVKNVKVPPLLSEVLRHKPSDSGVDVEDYEPVMTEGYARENEVMSKPERPNAVKHVKTSPLLSEVLRHKPSDSGVGVEDDEPVMTEGYAREREVQSKHERSSGKEYTPRPPPPRPPPPRRPAKQPTLNAKHSRRPTHPTPPPDSFEERFSRPLPPLKEEAIESSPSKSQDYDSKNSKSFELSDNVVQLNNAAAQLLLMQGMNSGLGRPSPVAGNRSDSHPSSPNRHSPSITPKSGRNLSRSYSQPTAKNETLPFERLNRMSSQPNINATSLPRASSSRFNNSSPSLLNPGNALHRHRRVEQMPFTDEFGDSGLYTGEVNEDCRPNGQGKMKYDNGVFFEGKWNNGVREGNLAQRERMLSGFSSWKSASKKGGGNSVVHGMTWIDRFGKAGQYTGDVNEHSVPHGKGVMKYDFGLIAEGEWVNGVLIDGQNIGAGGGMTATGGTVMGGMPGGSVYPGMAGATMVSGKGMGGISTMGPTFPQQPMMNNMNMGGMGNAMYGNPSGGQGPPTFIRKNTEL